MSESEPCLRHSYVALDACPSETHLRTLLIDRRHPQGLIHLENEHCKQPVQRAQSQQFHQHDWITHQEHPASKLVADPLCFVRTSPSPPLPLPKTIAKDINETYVATNKPPRSASSQRHEAITSTGAGSVTINSPGPITSNNPILKTQNQRRLSSSRPSSPLSICQMITTDTDPSYYSALEDTNIALKTEVNRLAPFEHRCKLLEEEKVRPSMYIDHTATIPISFSL